MQLRPSNCLSDAKLLNATVPRIIVRSKQFLRSFVYGNRDSSVRDSISLRVFQNGGLIRTKVTFRFFIIYEKLISEMVISNNNEYAVVVRDNMYAIIINNVIFTML